jgi:Icc-related predicted phosphoesterase
MELGCYDLTIHAYVTRSLTLSLPHFLTLLPSPCPTFSLSNPFSPYHSFLTLLPSPPVTSHFSHSPTPLSLSHFFTLIFSPCILLEYEQEDKDKVQEGENEVKTVVDTILGLEKPTFFIPGNHDPVTMFTHPSYARAVPRAGGLNLHGQMLTLCPGLVIIAFGGSHPAFQDDKQKWNGFPYLSHEEIDKALTAYINLALEKVGEEEQVILMTHVGPASTNTSWDTRDTFASPIYTGSKALDTILKENQEKILCNIHG